MEADIVRLILFVAGVVLVLGIYFWDRYKRINRRIRKIQDRMVHDPAQIPSVPIAGLRDDDPADIDRELDVLGEMIADRHATGGAPAHQTPTAPRAPEQDKAENRSPDAGPGIPTLIVQINVIAVGAYFRGPALADAVRETGLEVDDMNIFHRYAESSGSSRGLLFSLVSMVEPGVFPMDDMEGFSTPGITLFAQFPGSGDPLAVFSDMLFTAERLAALLDGELQDATHSSMTRQTIGHIREKILEHRRQVQLAQARQ